MIDTAINISAVTSVTTILQLVTLCILIFLFMVYASFHFLLLQQFDAGNYNRRNCYNPFKHFLVDL